LICRVLRRLLTLGLPVAIQITSESGVFAFVTTLIAKLGPVPLASHQIALNTVAFTYMSRSALLLLPAVRVGQPLAVGIPRSWGCRRHCYFLGAAFMACASAGLLLFPRWESLGMTRQTKLSFIAHHFPSCSWRGLSVIDGLQTVATGSLRGAGDTRHCHVLPLSTSSGIIGVHVPARQTWLDFKLCELGLSAEARMMAPHPGGAEHCRQRKAR